MIPFSKSRGRVNAGPPFVQQPLGQAPHYPKSTTAHSIDLGLLGFGAFLCSHLMVSSWGSVLTMILAKGLKSRGRKTLNMGFKSSITFAGWRISRLGSTHWSDFDSIVPFFLDCSWLMHLNSLLANQGQRGITRPSLKLSERLIAVEDALSLALFFPTEPHMP
jgi:hypothetical protein